MAVIILIVPFCTMVPYVAPAVFMADIMQSFGVDMSLAGLSMTILLSVYHRPDRLSASEGNRQKARRQNKLIFRRYCYEF